MVNLSEHLLTLLQDSVHSLMHHAGPHVLGEIDLHIQWQSWKPLPYKVMESYKSLVDVTNAVEKIFKLSLL